MNEANNPKQLVTFESTIESVGGTETNHNSNVDESKVKTPSSSSSPNLEQEGNSQPKPKPQNYENTIVSYLNKSFN